MKLTLACLFPLLLSTAMSAPDGYNYDESKLPPYTLPSVLGDGVKAAADWPARKQAILDLLAREEYGQSPPLPGKVKMEISLPVGPAAHGKALRQQLTIYFNEAGTGPFMDVLLYLPAQATGPVPMFWGLNFEGNHAVDPDPAIPLCRAWMPEGKNIRDHHATDEGRGLEAGRWQFEMAVEAGFGVATACYHDVDPDFDDGFKNGVHAMFPELEAKRDGATWASIAAYAWGLRVGMNVLEKDPRIDSKRVIVMGHSRLGKAALWAGATDERFALVISNDSGAGGAALHKRIFGETVERINSAFPHWFCGNFKKYSGNETDLPFDQHFVLACIAPRALLVCSATEDLWADPKGEFLSAQAASEVYHLLGQEGLTATVQPPPDQLVNSRVGYHLRTGPHEVTKEDWAAYLAFAKQHLPLP